VFEMTNEAEKRAEIAKYVRAAYRNIQHFGEQCSILPDGNTAIPAQMIGLNAVRFIREDSDSYVVDDWKFDNDDWKKHHNDDDNDAWKKDQCDDDDDDRKKK
ncbi:hypothetical protein NLX67_22650, partial [Domibacillus sp. A3M-37]|nr:hypothetical protein [Domibacillus sp. A3M-37]